MMNKIWIFLTVRGVAKGSYYYSTRRNWRFFFLVPAFFQLWKNRNKWGANRCTVVKAYIFEE